MLNLNLNLNLNDHELLCDDATLHPAQELEGVAIIGMDAKAGSALTKEALWQAFRDGLDMVTELPENRIPDAVNFAKIAYGKQVEQFSQRAYLPEIDSFESQVFKISHREAELMDPVQRIFLESAWCALEDAGYGGSRLSGSRTGVYVGFNQVGDSYESLLKDAPSETLGLTVSGNITSFLASRISYLLDLTGPAMVIDTACSSSLVALHQACKAIQRGEVEMAIVGSVRIFFCPEKTGEDIGTTSSSERTKSFDASADGTGGGEGVINLVLKPLRAAVRDRDHIYGVVKGSCVNQDGSSIGITAPNSGAQEKCLMEAWEEAGIQPEQLTYIEAHGTATRLGDPVEIGGLTAAFSHYTRKKQFCALGAAKSNFGHLDCCSGLLGVVKVLLMMENRMIPPSLHFCSPNSKIDYVHSPVFINDTLRPWESDDGVLTAGVSSFGLSGTNCHVVLQSYEMPSYPMTLALTHQLLTVSAVTKESLRSYLLKLQAYLKGRSDISLGDLCYSLNVGRGQHSFRFAMVLWDIPEFLSLSEDELFSEKYYAYHRLVSKETNEPGLLSATQRKYWTDTAAAAIASGDLDTLAAAYLQGGEIDFLPLYESSCVKMLSLPSYAFSKTRCWYEGTVLEIDRSPGDKIHPLLDHCITDSFGLRVYEKLISPKSCMELREHRIHGVCVLPGTVYVEMIHEIGKRHYGTKPFRFATVTFFHLLTCDPDEERILHCIATEDADSLHVRIASKDAEGQWINHVEGVLAPTTARDRQKVDIPEMLSHYSSVLTEKDQDEQTFVQLGEHWQTGEQIYVSEDSVVLFSRVPASYSREAEAYTLYPPLLDGSMNSGIFLLDGQYLPLNYSNMHIFSPLRGDTYSRITRLTEREQSDQIALFHVELLSPDGVLIGEIEEYSLKRVNDAEHFLREPSEEETMYDITWVKQEDTIDTVPVFTPSAAVILHREEQSSGELLKDLEKRFTRVVHIIPGDRYCFHHPDLIYVENTEKDMQTALNTLGDLRSFLFIDLMAYCPDPENVDFAIEDKLHSAFCWIKSLSTFPGGKQLRFVTMNATRVTGTEDFYCPVNQALIGFCSCIESEQSDMELHIIDADPHSSVSVVADSLLAPSGQFVTAIRQDQLYLEKLVPYSAPIDAVEIRNEDVILITGGYGGIGLSVSEEIFSLAPDAKILLLNRSCRHRTEYEAKLHALQDQGCHIRLLEGDVTCRESFPSVLESIRKEYGHIDGVIHGAGVAGDGMLIHKSWDTALQVLLPKIRGTVLLDQLTQRDSLRFMVLFSSFTSAVGAPGQTDYTAANAFLDSYSYYRNLAGRRTISINWTGWRESGMAVDHGVQWQSSIVHFVSDAEGKQYFRQALNLGGPRVIACSFPEGIPHELGSRFLLPKGQETRNTAMEPEVITEGIPIIYGKSPDKLTPVEKNIALAWARTLHVAEVHLYDKFFEAGGNSLLASYLQKEINRIYPDAMAITDVFVYSTISDIAAYITGKLEPPVKEMPDGPVDGGNIEDLVQQFMNGELSLEDLENLV